MNDFAEQRMYQRSDNVVYEATVRKGNTQWPVTELRDISAVGLRFGSEQTFHIGDLLFIDLDFYNMLSKFNIILKGTVIRIDLEHEKRIYVIRFEDTDKNTRIQLDELIRNNLSLCRASETMHEHEHSQDHVLPKFDFKNKENNK